MKCPKCGYLGFDTGNRCKNCGYDFSLLGAIPDPPLFTTPDPDLREPDLSLRSKDETAPADDVWFRDLDDLVASRVTEPDTASGASGWLEHGTGDAEPAGPERLSPEATSHEGAAGREPATAALPPRSRTSPPAARASGGAKLPLFGPPGDEDAPLVSLPLTPRAPLAVRRTPEVPRLKSARARITEPPLDFQGGPRGDDEPPASAQGGVRPGRGGIWSDTLVTASVEPIAGRRLSAAALDYLILLSIDAAVLYFTVRMAGLQFADLGSLPPVPLVAFLGLVKVAYFTAFTGIGGQTIGKMAFRIRVVGEEAARDVDAARAVRRTLAALLTHLTLGLGYLPAFVGADRRALHDRLAGTRVVSLPGA